MDKQPFFSIIIPTYQRPEYLKRAISSVLDQTFKQWEVIIVVDGACEASQMVVKAYTNDKISYIVLQDQKRQGYCRNIGIDQADGQYICFLDDDDYYLNDHLEHLSKGIQKSTAKVAVFKSGYFYELKGKRRIIENYDAKKEEPAEYLLRVKVNMLSMAFHRTIFNQIRFPHEFPIAQDHFFLHQVFSVFPLFQLKGKGTAVYVRHGNNITLSGVDLYAVDQKVKAFQQLFNSSARIAQLLDQEEKEAFIERIYLYASSIAAKKGAIKLALQLFKRATSVGKTQKWLPILIMPTKLFLLYIGSRIWNRRID